MKDSGRRQKWRTWHGMVSVALLSFFFSIFHADLASAGLGFNDGNYVRVEDSPSLDLTGSITLETWIYKTNNGEDWNIIFSKPWDWDGNPWHVYRLGLTYAGNVPKYATCSLALSGGIAGVSGTSVIPDNAWVHLACTYDGSEMKMYVNGSLEGTQPASGSINTNDQPLIIGRNLLNWWNDWFGYIDEVRVWSVARTQEQIQQSMGRSLAGDETGLAGYWRFNEGSGLIARDSSGNGNDGVLIGNPVWGEDAPLCAAPPPDMVGWWRGEGDAGDSEGANDGTPVNGVSFDPGKVGQAFGLDGIDDHVLVENPWDLGSSSALSISVWVHPRNTAHGGILRKGAAETHGAYALALYLNKFYFQLNEAELNMASNSDIPPDTWTHLAVTYDQTAGTAAIYVNGVLDQTQPYSETINTDPIPLYIGVYGISPQAYFDGLLDEIAIFNRALTAGEIVEIHQAGSVGMCSKDTTPDAFTFVSQSGVLRNAQIPSNTITVSGIDHEAPISITACTSSSCAYSVNGGTWISDPSTVKNGDTVRVRQISSPAWSTATTLTLTIGGVAGTFNVTTQVSATLTAAIAGSGAGSLSSTPAGIDCGSDCTEVYAAGTSVTLKAAAAPGSSLTDWSGCDAYVGSQCTVAVSGDKSVTATFEVSTYAIHASVIGGNGSISCATPVLHGSDAVCTVTPDPNYRLSALTDNGADVLASVSGNTYTVEGVTAEHAVTASFAPIPLHGPDLTLSWLEVSSRANGRYLRGKLNIGNAGDQIAHTFKVAIYLSDDGRDPGKYLGAYNFRNFKPGRYSPRSVSHRSMSPLIGKYLLAIIDPADAVQETNEANNQAAIPIQ